jgi:type IV pilus assembly protein PilY1
VRNKLIRLVHGAIGALLVAGSSIALGDDTDVYLNPGAGLPPGSEPLVMFSLDYRPNLGSTACNGDQCDALIAEGYLPPVGPYTFFDVLRAALRKVMDPLEGVRVGLMLNHTHESNCEGPDAGKCSNGGYIAMGFESFLVGDANGAKARFHGILDAMPTPQGGQSHSYQGKELFFEFFRYLTGQGIYNAHNGWTDYFTDNKKNLDADGARYDWDASIESGANYVTPLATAGECTSIYTVNSMFFVSNQGNDSDSAIEAEVVDGGFGIKVGNNDFAGVVGYLNDADLANGNYGDAPTIDGAQKVTSYFLVDERAINKTTVGYAQAGGTGVPLALSQDPDELVRTLQDIFAQILSVSTTFVAASVPVNVFNRAEIVDNVYVALFQVDQDKKPAWIGNLKKLRLSDIDGTSLLVDALDNPAIAGDGRIRRDALTLWTDPWTLPPPDPDEKEVDQRDGRSVARGGAGQQLPGFVGGSPGLVNAPGNRRLYYDRGGSLLPLNVDVAAATDLQGDLGAATANEAGELIAFARGNDIDDLDRDGDIDDAREWIFGDPLHSRPLPLNYGARSGYSVTNPAIYLAVASNDGFLHFIRNTMPGGAQSGAEAWAFMPRTAMGAHKTLRANGVGTPHPYTVDGSPVAYIEDLNNNGSIEAGESAYLYVGMRRGGKALYALDVSNPENPALLWTIEKGAGDFAELGYTFSTPRVGHVDIGSGPQPVLVFGGGYDMNKDDRSGVGTNDVEGAAIFVVDALNGDLIWKARGPVGVSSSQVFQHPDLVDSIPSPVSVGDTDGDLLLDRVVVGDTGGNVWRADIQGPDTAAWKLTRLAVLGRHLGGGKADDRRFFHRPDLVQAKDDKGAFDAVLIGSGDRPDPLDGGGVVENWFYMIKDRNVVPGSGVDVDIEPVDLGDVTDNCLQEGGACAVDLTNGWRLQLEDTGEKSLATPLTIAGRVFFTTYIPQGGVTAGSVCAPSEGRGRLYAVALQDASSVVNYDTTDDDPSKPDEATTKSDRSTNLNAPGIPAEVVSIPPNKVLRPDLQVDELNIDTRWRTFWYLEEDADL